jgi:hypothetical protein
MLDRLDTSEALKRLGAELSPDKGRQAAQPVPSAVEPDVPR